MLREKLLQYYPSLLTKINKSEENVLRPVDGHRRFIMDLFSTNNAATKTVAVATGIFTVGFASGMFIGRSFKKRGVAEGYINDLAADLGVKVNADNILKQIEDGVKKAPKAEAAKPAAAPAVAPAAAPAVVATVTTVETAPAAAHAEEAVPAA